MRYVHLNGGAVQSWSGEADIEHNIEAPDSVSIGWILTGGVWSNPAAETARKAAIDLATMSLILSAIGYTIDQLNFAQTHQINMSTRGSILMSKEAVDTLTENEALTLQYLRDLWQFIEDTRAHGRARKADSNVAQNYPVAPVKPESVIV